ncbi:MAG: hypothetical protein ACRD0P_10670 [Stackebrandtia sp.]
MSFDNESGVADFSVPSQHGQRDGRPGAVGAALVFTTASAVQSLAGTVYVFGNLETNLLVLIAWLFGVSLGALGTFGYTLTTVLVFRRTTNARTTALAVYGISLLMPGYFLAGIADGDPPPSIWLTLFWFLLFVDCVAVILLLNLRSARVYFARRFHPTYPPGPQ